MVLFSRSWMNVAAVLLASCVVTTAPPVTPGSGPPVVAAWQRSGSLDYSFAARGRGTTSNETLKLVFAGGDDATVTSVAGTAPVEFTAAGKVRPKSTADAGAVLVPPYTHLFMVGPAVGQLAVGESAAFRLPDDGEIAPDELTVQSEVKVTLRQRDADVATYDFETRYRIVDNAALTSFRSDAKEAAGTNVDAVAPIIDGALEFRLAGFGEVAFDIAQGRMLKASYTGAGLPLAKLDRAGLAASSDALTYELTLSSP